MAKYPIFIELKEKRVVMIGGGQIALRKAQVLVETQCRLVVVTKEVCPALESLCARYQAGLVRGPYMTEYLGEALLVVAATNNRPLNEQIYRDCQARQILCNVVDQPDLCDFHVPAIVQRGSLQIAVSTNGASPAFAGHVRHKIEQCFTEKHGEFLDLLLWAREQTLAHFADPNQKKMISGWLAGDASFDVFVTQGPEAWRALAAQKIAEGTKAE
ncbi:MAG: bifunctional precorrin-2 dehydrogenase/sirohydrochlorin ferrochelatase [Phycisphaerae bacterium]|nr:bifunctional precorrin-2 dehydrogenase/sirohydrochlorin ferrochelatase [Phycisphaerae bacterium]